MNAIRTLRGVLNITQREVAKGAEISTRELARIEKGEIYAPAETMRRIDASLDAIIKGRLSECDA